MLKMGCVWSSACVFPCSWWERVCSTCCAWPTCICCRDWSASVGEQWRRRCARTTWCTCGRRQSFSSSPGWKISVWSTWLRLFIRCVSVTIWAGAVEQETKRNPPSCSDDAFTPDAPVCHSLWSNLSWQRPSKRTLTQWRGERPPTPSPWWTKSASTLPATCKHTAKSKRPTRNWRPWKSFSRPLIFAAEEAAGGG